ncbi:peptidoglycan DD-metalloendopeptidase family protein [bacterium]|nr:peptidoglycan DD-metalloendopeptidase family protein [bacterium]
MKTDPAPLFPFPLAEARPVVLAGADFDVADPAAMAAFIAQARGTAPAAIGGYGENRGIYAASPLFGTPAAGVEPRVIHLGVDVWTEAGTPVSAPLDAVVHSFADNDRFGDYGGTVILEHRTAAGVFWTLYGHLARRSLAGLAEGRMVGRGEVFAWLGEPAENGGWPPHLHFQKITDMLGMRGDFPGVARASEKEDWLGLCPDPSDLMV